MRVREAWRAAVHGVAESEMTEWTITRGNFKVLKNCPRMRVQQLIIQNVTVCLFEYLIYLINLYYAMSLLLQESFLQLQWMGFSSWWLLLLLSKDSCCLGFRSCGAGAQLFCGIWNLPGPGIETVSPALAGGLPSTVLPGKSYLNILNNI